MLIKQMSVNVRDDDTDGNYGEHFIRHIYTRKRISCEHVYLTKNEQLVFEG